MPDERKLALFLFASLGLNIFLGGVLGGKMLSQRDERVAVTAQGAAPDRNPNQSATEAQPQQQKSDRPRPDRKEPWHRSEPTDARRGGPGRPDSQGPSDLMLLRQMIRTMGGPKDPRLAKLQEEHRGEIRRIRADMQAAHKRVHQALTADQHDEKELGEALKNLRKTAFESQAKAQEGILTLAALMTPEERARLRKLQPEPPKGDPRGPNGRFGHKKGGPHRDKGPPQSPP